MSGYIVVSGGKFLTNQRELASEYPEGAFFTTLKAARKAVAEAKLDGHEIWEHEAYVMGGEPREMEYSAARLAEVSPMEPRS